VKKKKNDVKFKILSTESHLYIAWYAEEENDKIEKKAKKFAKECIGRLQEIIKTKPDITLKIEDKSIERNA